MTAFDDLDFIGGFRTYQADKADMLGEKFSEAWVSAQSRIACRIIVNEVPLIESRYRARQVDAETIQYVVSCMVARVASWSPIHSETSSAYAYTRDAPVSTPPDYTPSASLYLKASEKRLLAMDDQSGPMGSVTAGLARIWGG